MGYSPALDWIGCISLCRDCFGIFDYSLNHPRMQVFLVDSTNLGSVGFLGEIHLLIRLGRLVAPFESLLIPYMIQLMFRAAQGPGHLNRSDRDAGAFPM